jgi:hypothetical protein
MTKHWTPYLDRELADLFGRGFSYSEIADRLAPNHGGVLSRNAVAGRLGRLGLVRNVKPAPTEHPKIYPERGEVRPAKPKLVKVVPEPVAHSFDRIGVLYHDNTGCTATLSSVGDDGLPICCGRPLCTDPQGRKSRWCKGHFTIFVRRTRNDREYINGKAGSLR